MNGVCPSYKMWSWSLYDPKTGSTKHGGTMISAAGSDIGAVNSSFATAAATNRLDVAETQYCIRLDDWWTGVNQEYETRMSKSIVIQIGGESASIATTTGGKREHRLIKDAHPSAPPGGYFDCTVEVCVSSSFLSSIETSYWPYRFYTDIEAVTVYIRSTLQTTPQTKVSPPSTPIRTIREHKSG